MDSPMDKAPLPRERLIPPNGVQRQVLNVSRSAVVGDDACRRLD